MNNYILLKDMYIYVLLDRVNNMILFIRKYGNRTIITDYTKTIEEIKNENKNTRAVDDWNLFKTGNINEFKYQNEIILTTDSFKELQEKCNSLGLKITFNRIRDI